ncbi:MAG: hypothetical protein R3F43_08300 [bacterium]
MGSDWFDLGVEFTLEGKTVRTDQVLEAWAQGRRYVESTPGGGCPASGCGGIGGRPGRAGELRHGGGWAFAAPLARACWPRSAARRPGA